jgi:hypothetical protein
MRSISVYQEVARVLIDYAPAASLGNLNLGADIIIHTVNLTQTFKDTRPLPSYTDPLPCIQLHLRFYFPPSSSLTLLIQLTVPRRSLILLFFLQLSFFL